MAKLGVSELWKPINQLSQNLAWAISSSMSPCTPKLKAIALVGVSWQMGEILLLCDFYVFIVFCDLSFYSCPETKPQKRFWCCLIHRTLIPGYCIPGGIKLQKVFVLPDWYYLSAHWLYGDAVLSNISLFEFCCFNCATATVVLTSRFKLKFLTLIFAVLLI